MERLIQIFEKIMTYFQILTGLFIFLFAIWGLIIWNDTLELNSLNFLDTDLFIRLNLSFLLAILFISSGILLFKNNKNGWALSIISWFGLFCHLFITITKIGVGYNNFDISQTFFIVLPFLLFALFFLNIQTRKRYKVSKIDFYFIIITSSLLMIDSLYVNEFLK